MKISFKHDYCNLGLINSMWGALMKECTSINSMTTIEEDDEIFTKRIHDVLRIKL